MSMSKGFVVRRVRRCASAAGACFAVIGSFVRKGCARVAEDAKYVHARLGRRPRTEHREQPEQDEILRFRKSERYLHWAVAAPFMVSYTSALILVAVYNLNPTRPYRDVFSWIHRMSGVYLAILPFWTILRHRHDFEIHFKNVRHAWTWSIDDFKWLALMPASNLIPSITLPHQGKFNAAEKINFMVLVTTYPLYIITGVLIWLPGVALVPWLLHFTMAVMATPLMAGHIFMATINPETRVGLTGMITGFVSREWAKHHYRLWYDEHYGHEELTVVPNVQEDVAEPADRPARAEHIPAAAGAAAVPLHTIPPPSSSRDLAVSDTP